jgi:hypothetical protein
MEEEDNGEVQHRLMCDEVHQVQADCGASEKHKADKQTAVATT